MAMFVNCMKKFLFIVAVLLQASIVFAQSGGYSGPPLTFSQLPTNTAGGQSRNCTDCSVASPCTGSGTGAIANSIIIGGVSQWNCYAYGTNSSPPGGPAGVTLRNLP